MWLSKTVLYVDLSNDNSKYGWAITDDLWSCFCMRWFLCTELVCVSCAMKLEGVWYDLTVLILLSWSSTCHILNWIHVCEGSHWCGQRQVMGFLGAGWIWHGCKGVVHAKIEMLIEIGTMWWKSSKFVCVGKFDVMKKLEVWRKNWELNQA